MCKVYYPQEGKYRFIKQGSLPACHVWTRFLLSYRNTSHSTTGQAPAELFLQRTLRTRLDILRPCVESRAAAQQQQQKTAHDRRAKDHSFTLGQAVLVKNWREGHCWVKGVIIRVLGAVQYEVDAGESTTWRCHADHLLPAKGDSSGGGFGAPAISQGTSHAEEVHGILLILQGAQQPMFLHQRSIRMKGQRPQRTLALITLSLTNPSRTLALITLSLIWNLVRKCPQILEVSPSRPLVRLTLSETEYLKCPLTQVLARAKECHVWTLVLVHSNYAHYYIHLPYTHFLIHSAYKRATSWYVQTFPVILELLRVDFSLPTFTSQLVTSGMVQGDPLSGFKTSSKALANRLGLTRIQLGGTEVGGGWCCHKRFQLPNLMLGLIMLNLTPNPMIPNLMPNDPWPTSENLLYSLRCCPKALDRLMYLCCGGAPLIGGDDYIIKHYMIKSLFQ